AWSSTLGSDAVDALRTADGPFAPQPQQTRAQQEEARSRGLLEWPAEAASWSAHTPTSPLRQLGEQKERECVLAQASQLQHEAGDKIPSSRPDDPLRQIQIGSYNAEPRVQEAVDNCADDGKLVGGTEDKERPSAASPGSCRSFSASGHREAFLVPG
ncbi:unnamed protein product, partial [Amoebophrya sp. A25]